MTRIITVVATVSVPDDLNDEDVEIAFTKMIERHGLTLVPTGWCPDATVAELSDIDPDDWSCIDLNPALPE